MNKDSRLIQKEVATNSESTQILLSEMLVKYKTNAAHLVKLKEQTKSLKSVMETENFAVKSRRDTVNQLTGQLYELKIEQESLEQKCKRQLQEVNEYIFLLQKYSQGMCNLSNETRDTITKYANEQKQYAMNDQRKERMKQMLSQEDSQVIQEAQNEFSVVTDSIYEQKTNQNVADLPTDEEFRAAGDRPVYYQNRGALADSTLNDQRTQKGGVFSSTVENNRTENRKSDPARPKANRSAENIETPQNVFRQR